MEPVGELDGFQVYTSMVKSERFQRHWRVVDLVKPVGNKRQTALLFATGLDQDANSIIRFYQARFQIEFWFRDAKPFLGLNHCQARHAKALHFHFNASMTALNLIKLEDRPTHSKVIFMASWKIRQANEHLLEHFSSSLGLDFNSIKSRPDLDLLGNYGAIAT